MCLILLAWQAHPNYPLVVAANRDEFFARPTATAAFWPQAQQVLAGRDLQAGGTWLGVTRTGRFAALTNYRDPAQNRQLPSRGALVADFLTGSETPEAYLARIAASGVAYNGYNLLLGDGKRLWWASNVSGERRPLAPGIYGVSNDLLDTPRPKVGAGKTALTQAIDHLPDDRPLFNLLQNDAIHPDEHLPATGVPQDWERLLSAAFVKSPSYGTRSSTVLYQRCDGWITFDEQIWLAGAQRGARVRYRLVVAEVASETEK
ncbi:signal peptide protein [Rugosibacter aromaticivorans]|uniref:Signal peptide protein n=1 Tax=Rugosibacter aromaticivorans TaxID=1565605 RepID=A0A0C5J9C8_9PROT|nr:NRDE family protein [Rugosibacter aromaticivorans]AJP48358.1 signal peptide protein [Rugosibacter aromaticivorans]TBR13781.1 MAG: NRDE family protein [Rugosibacter sp.]